jgi:hypothetical protein
LIALYYRREFLTLGSDTHHALVDKSASRMGFSKMRKYKIAKRCVSSYALLITFAASLALISGSDIKAQQIPGYEPDAKITYHRFENATEYESERVTLEPRNKEEFGGATVDLKVVFFCNGNTGEQPCIVPQVMLVFAYSYSKVFDEFQQQIEGRRAFQQPFNYQARNVIAITDGKHLLLGSMKVSGSYDAKDQSSFWSGVMMVDLSALRRLVTASEVEMKVGTLPVILTDANKETLGNFYNVAMMSVPETSPRPRSTRRPKRRQ